MQGPQRARGRGASPCWGRRCPGPESWGHSHLHTDGFVLGLRAMLPFTHSLVRSSVQHVSAEHLPCGRNERAAQLQPRRPRGDPRNAGCHPRAEPPDGVVLQGTHSADAGMYPTQAPSPRRLSVSRTVTPAKAQTSPTPRGSEMRLTQGRSPSSFRGPSLGGSGKAS